MRLDIACSAIVDCEHKTAPIDESGDYYAVGTPAMRDHRIDYAQARRISRETFDAWTRRLRPAAGDLLLAREAPVGPVVRLPEDANVAPGQRTVLLRPDPAVTSSAYLYYALRSPAAQAALLVKAEGSTVHHLNVPDIRSFDVRIPQLPEQQAIAEVLGALDDKIAANTRLVDLVLTTTNSEFARRFGERGLEVPLGDLADVVDCLHSKKPERTSDGPPLMQLNNIRDDGLLDRGLNYPISTEDYVEWSRRFEARAWDLVITNVGRVGAVARIPEGYVAALGRNMTGIRPRDAAESGSFIAVALLSNAVRREIELRTDAGSVMSALNVRSVPLLRLQYSSPAERRAFHDVASPLLEAADQSLSENATLAVTRDALIPLLISGKLRVRDAEVLVAEAGV